LTPFCSSTAYWAPGPLSGRTAPYFSVWPSSFFASTAEIPSRSRSSLASGLAALPAGAAVLSPVAVVLLALPLLLLSSLPPQAAMSGPAGTGRRRHRPW